MRRRSASIRDCTLLIGAVVATRFLFRSHLLYDLDSVNFALALRHFDPALHQPHPPGYFLYVCLGRLLFLLFHDANAALVALSIAASGAAVAGIYFLSDAWFGRRAAVFSGLLFMLSPLSWFHGTVALTYISEAFFSALVGYLCWQTYTGRTGFLVPSAIVLAAAMGFRQSSVLFLGPLWLLSLRNTPARQVLRGVAALAIAVTVWFIPMMMASGGIVKYFTSLYDLWARVPAAQTFSSGRLTDAFGMVVSRFCTIALIFALCFGLAGPLLFLRSEGKSAPTEIKLFIWVWLAPSLFFFTFVFLRFVNSGYLLVASPPIFAWLGSRVAAWHSAVSVKLRQRTIVLAAAAAIHVAAFLYTPFYCSFRSVRMFEAELTAVQKGLAQVASPADTMIVSFDSHFMGYRHAGYYLPDYWTVQFPEVRLPVGTRVFAMFHGQTELLSRPPGKPFRNFVIFPLPKEDSFREYLQNIKAEFPKGALRTAQVGNCEFLTGSTADLHILFPSARSPRGQASPQDYSAP